MFKLCDRQGYTYNMSMYTGKGDYTMSLATDVVLTLTAPYLQSGRTICTDNYYTNLPLAEQLLHANTHLVGTMRQNRKGIPKEVCNARLKKGEVIARENSLGVVIMKWRDKRDVLLSTHTSWKRVRRRIGMARRLVSRRLSSITINPSKASM